MTVLIIALLIAAVILSGRRAFSEAIVEINTAHIEELASHDMRVINNNVNARLTTLKAIAKDLAYWSSETNIEALLHADAPLSSPALWKAI